MTSSEQPMDHVPPHEQREKSDLERNLTARGTWIRLAFMILYGFLYMISRIVTIVVVVVQFVTVLLTDSVNAQLQSFGHSLAIYAYEIVNYLTFNTEVRPFPLDSPWPDQLPQAEETSPIR